MTNEKLEKAIQLQAKIKDYTSCMRDMRNRNKEKYTGLTIPHRILDEIEEEMVNLYGLKIIELEKEFQGL